MIHHKDFPFHEPDEDSEIIHLSPRGDWRLSPRRIITFIVVIALLIVTVKALFDLGRGDMGDSGIPVVEANPEPYKVKPDDPGGMAIPHIDKEIYDKIKMPIEEPIDAYAENHDRDDDLARLLAREGAGGSDRVELGNRKLESDFAPETKPESKTIKLSSNGNTTIVTGSAAANSDVIKAKRIDVEKVLSKNNPNEIWLQLGTFKTEDEATKAWQDVKENNADILGDLMVKVTKADTSDKGAYYRLQAGSVDTDAMAKTYCKKLNDRNQNCFFTTSKQ